MNKDNVKKSTDNVVVVKNNQKESFFSKLYKFPSILNRTTSIMLILLVLGIVSVSLVLIAKQTKQTLYYIPESSEYFNTSNNKENIQPISDYENHFIYSPELNSYIEILTQNEKTTTNDEEKIASKYTIKLVNKLNNDLETRLLHFKHRITSLTEDGIIRYYNETTTSSTVSDYTTLGKQGYYSNTTSTKVIDTLKNYNSYLDKIYIKMQYGNETTNFDRYYSFVEEILKLDDRDLDEYNEVSKINDVFEVSISLTSDTSNEDTSKHHYLAVLKINILHNAKGQDGENIVNVPYHIDAQSYFVTKDGSIYPLIGVYNYGFNNTKVNSSINYTSPTSTSAAKIYKNMDAEYIYIKAIHTDKDYNKSEILYKVSLESLLA